MTQPESPPKQLLIDIPPLLTHYSINPSAQTTLLLLHGACSSPDEYLATSTHFPNHHLLIPYLPGHGTQSTVSQHIQPFSLLDSSRHLQTLVTACAKNGITHVVGVSLGAHVALHFVQENPTLVSSCFISGHTRFATPSGILSPLRPVLPYAMTAMSKLENMIPSSWRNWALDVKGEDMPIGKSTVNVRLMGEIVGVLCCPKGFQWRPWDGEKRRIRCLVVAATKRGIVRSADSASECEKVVKEICGGETGREEGDGVGRIVAVEMENMRHPWQCQDPRLFAMAVIAWIERGALIEEEMRVIVNQA